MENLLKTDNVFLFVPNLIGKTTKINVGKLSNEKKNVRLGYVRVFLSIVSFYFMPTHPTLTVVCYLTSEFLDALDGHAARALGQSRTTNFDKRKVRTKFF